MSNNSEGAELIYGIMQEKVRNRRRRKRREREGRTVRGKRGGVGVMEDEEIKGSMRESKKEEKEKMKQKTDSLPLSYIEHYS